MRRGPRGEPAPGASSPPLKRHNQTNRHRFDIGSCITVHDGSTITTPDPEYPFILGTMQGHAAGGSILAAAAIPRGEPLGFTVNVNVKLRGRLDINLGCDQHKLFDFSVPLVY